MSRIKRRPDDGVARREDRRTVSGWRAREEPHLATNNVERCDDDDVRVRARQGISYAGVMVRGGTRARRCDGFEGFSKGRFSYHRHRVGEVEGGTRACSRSSERLQERERLQNCFTVKSFTKQIVADIGKSEKIIRASIASISHRGQDRNFSHISRESFRRNRVIIS